MVTPKHSFGGVADYCLHNPHIVEEITPQSAQRVE